MGNLLREKGDQLKQWMIKVSISCYLAINKKRDTKEKG